MATQVHELSDGRSYSIGQSNSRKYTRTWRVVFDSAEMRGDQAVDAVGVYRDQPYGLGCYCTDISATAQNDGYEWLVTAHYGPQPEVGLNPLSEPYDVAWSFAQFETTVDRDIYGTAILNSAGDPFADPITCDDSRPVLTITRNEAFFNAPLAYGYRDAINATPFFGAPPKTVKVSSINSQRRFDQTYGWYWTTTYVFHFSMDGFTKSILDQGFREIKDGKKQNITVQGVPVTEAALLRDGKAIPRTGQPSFLDYEVYPVLPFTVFNF